MSSRTQKNKKNMQPNSTLISSTSRDYITPRQSNKVTKTSFFAFPGDRPEGCLISNFVSLAALFYPDPAFSLPTKNLGNQSRFASLPCQPGGPSGFCAVSIEAFRGPRSFRHSLVIAIQIHKYPYIYMSTTTQRTERARWKHEYKYNYKDTRARLHTRRTA